MGTMFSIINFIEEIDPKIWGVCNSMPNKVISLGVCKPQEHMFGVCVRVC